MSLRSGVDGTLAVAMVAVVLLCGRLSAGPKPVHPVLAKAGGLQMSIYPDQAESRKSKIQKFRVELSNAGESGLILNLGIMLANGKKQYPVNVALILTDSQGKSRLLELIGPGMLNGRVDAMVLPLPAKSTFSIPIDLDSYWSTGSGEFNDTWKPGAYTLAAQFSGKGVNREQANLDMEGIALMPYWTGSVTSNQVRFEVVTR
jgi:hypothetical protein